jgi:superfamily II DNA or RNA helicase
MCGRPVFVERFSSHSRGEPSSSAIDESCAGNENLTDLFAEVVELKLPERFTFQGRILGAAFSHLDRESETVSATVEPYEYKKIAAFRARLPSGETIAFVDKATTSNFGCDGVLQVDDASSASSIAASLDANNGVWLFPKTKRALSVPRDGCIAFGDEALKSWKGKLTLRAEEVENAQVITKGLRPPQIGAVYATQAHWSVTNSPATVVMPTGTGKTETMLALTVGTPIRRLLVVVPNSNLRKQITQKFETLGVLKAATCLEESARYPVVAKLVSGPKTIEEVDEIFLRSNVIISTLQILGQAPPEVQARMAEHVDALFVDEAHHIAAKTWSAARAQFKRKRILQFTATPFRNDGRRVDGRFIYVYPLSKAQEENLFKPIKFVPVQGLDEEDADDKIVAEAVRVMREDRAAGFEHLVMARADTIARATNLFRKYAKAAPEATPVLIHSDLSRGERETRLHELIEKRSKIAVCVDMLGEGFDLPDLKIAALHDKQRSEAVTFQFVGRFTRTRNDLGDATVIANITGTDIKESLRVLYAEDADWNRVLSVVGAARTEKERRREEVFAGFSDIPEHFPLETLTPRMSTVVYKTTCPSWQPHAIEDMFKPGSIVEGPHINETERIAIFVKREEDRLRWTTAKEPTNVEYNLYMIHWDDNHGLLYINSSRLKDLHEDIAKKICGSDVERIRGENIFRVLDGFRRLILMNLGLSETQRKPVRYSSFMGSDIGEQLDTLPGNRNRMKTNLFGQGYTDDGKTTIGCSVKGKIWSYDTTNNFGDWIDWCHGLGRKLTDGTITTDKIIQRLVRPKRQTTRPPKRPIAIAWPETFLHLQEDKVEIEIQGVRAPFYDCDIELSSFSDGGPLGFRVVADERAADFEMTIDAAGAHYLQTSGPEVSVYVRGKEKLLREKFVEDPPHIYFADGDMLVDHDLFVLPPYEERPAFDLDKIEALDWTGVNIRKESLSSIDDDSVQAFMARRLRDSDAEYEVIYNDDGSGEIADLVAMRLSGSTLKVDLFHLKYSSSDRQGARVDDLFAVCGQAQKCIRWRERPDIFLDHLQKREAKAIRGGRPSRYLIGTPAIVNGWTNRWKEFSYEFSVSIVQPGYVKTAFDPSHLELFVSTEALLMDTWGMRFRVIAAEHT